MGARPAGIHPPAAMKPRQAKSRRPWGRLLLLGFLFAGTLAYHVRAAMVREPRWFGSEGVNRSFFVGEPFMAGGSEHNQIGYVSGNASRAGLRDGDILLSINGRVVTGQAVFGEAWRKSKPDDLMTVSVVRHEAGKPRREETVSFSLEPVRAWRWADIQQDILVLGLPLVSMVFGFWVAAARPRDPLAWLVLALMLRFTFFYYAGAESWPPFARDLGVIFRSASSSAFPIWLVLFGFYFPEPFPAVTRWSRWSWMKWILIVPLALFAAADVVTAVGELEHYAAVEFLERLPKAFLIAYKVCGYTAYVLPLGLIAARYSAAMSADSKRRLRLLAVGSMLTLFPLIVLWAVGGILGVNTELYFPAWLYWGVYFLFFLFPVVLAYVIVVEKAMDVRVVIRQGLQYGLAKNGVRVIQTSMALAAFLAAAALMADGSANRVEKLLVIGVGLALVPLAQRGADRLRHWVDRRFFREAYDAEQVLSDLSHQVRTMVEPQSLLRTVVTRISDTLHVRRMAALLDTGIPYRPVHFVGLEGVQDIEISPDSAAVKAMELEKKPLRVHWDDEDSWFHRDTAGAEEERTEFARLHAEILLPLAGREKLLGFISLGAKQSEEPFTGSDLRLLQSVANQTGLALENAQLVAAITEEAAQRERLNREVEIAREVQERLFPQELPPTAGLDYSGACRPALGVGGDYYDFLALPEGRLGIAIGDVSGKGIGAALIMASLEACLRAEAARAPENLGAMVGNVNRLVYQASTSNRYATFFYAQYDPASRRLTYVNAGHNPPMLFRPHADDWEVLRLTVGGMVVGLLEGCPYRQESTSLEPGDLLVAFTDGITEAMNAADEEWGEERLIVTVKSLAGFPAAQILSRIMDAADAFAHGAGQHDDMTLVVLRVEA
jgi:sigma-B regulation protein RsbU (phosphoserine phosphatase)